MHLGVLPYHDLISKNTNQKNSWIVVEARYTLRVMVWTLLNQDYLQHGLCQSIKDTFRIMMLIESVLNGFWSSCLIYKSFWDIAISFQRFFKTRATLKSVIDESLTSGTLCRKLFSSIASSSSYMTPVLLCDDKKVNMNSIICRNNSMLAPRLL